MKKINKNKFIAIIPARGGSKGIPRKNVKELYGEPLITWSIEAAKKSKLIGRFLVSTEDDEIAYISKINGAEVIKRPKELAMDNTSQFLVMQHVLTLVDCENIILLQPTSPIRDKDLIDNCINRYMKKNSDNLATGFMCKYMEYGRTTDRRQDINGFFYDDGNLYIWDANLIRSGKTFGNKIERFIVDKEQNIDINDDFDFWIAEQVLLKRIREGRQ